MQGRQRCNVGLESVEQGLDIAPNLWAFIEHLGASQD
jgi:hypothetical protein